MVHNSRYTKIGCLMGTKGTSRDTIQDHAQNQDQVETRILTDFYYLLLPKTDNSKKICTSQASGHLHKE